MDADRIDTLSRRLAAPATRRATLGTVAASGLLSALGLGRAAPEVRAAQAQTCVLAFATSVRLGPSVDQMLTTDGARPGELRGELSFALSDTGNLEDGELRLPNGARIPVVGQATGHALQVRIELGPRLVLVGVGVGEQEVAACQGEIDGLATGPQAGDLGDWHATALRQTGEAPKGSGGGGGNKNRDKTQNAGSGGSGAAGSGAAGSGQTSGGGAGGGNKDRGGGNKDRTRDTAPTGSTGATGSTGSSTASSPCAAGQTDCVGACVDLTVDPANCGACGNVCESGLVAVACRQGVCERADCPDGITYCGAVDGCRDLSFDPDHCGGCQQPCASGVCAVGVCGPEKVTCPTGQADCGEGCVDLSSDRKNCGACDNACADDQGCQGGVCTGGAPQCTGGLTDCGGVCVDLNGDALNCGACGLECAYGEVCGGGACQGLCGPGFSFCNGVCIDTTNDNNNCGGCGNVFACTANQVCQGGGCVELVTRPPDFVLTCADSGLTDCGGVCVDLLNDNNNCGACGNACYPGLCIFSSGTCSVCDPNNPPIVEGFCA